MEIRYFQIIIPIVALLLIFSQFRNYKSGKSRMNELIIVSIFWVGASCLAIFPDFISYIIADIFGIKDNVNALLFLAIGILFYFQFRMYKTIRRQDELLTKIARKIALDNPVK